MIAILYIEHTLCYSIFTNPITSFLTPHVAVDWLVVMLLIYKITHSNTSPQTCCPELFHGFFSIPSNICWDSALKQTTTTSPTPFSVHHSHNPYHSALHNLFSSKVLLSNCRIKSSLITTIK